MKWNPTGNWIGRGCLSTLWASSDEERQTRPCVCVRARLGADALITIIPNIHRSPPTCRINIRNVPRCTERLCGSAPTWIWPCLICDEGSQGGAWGSKSRENIFPLTAAPIFSSQSVSLPISFNATSYRCLFRLWSGQNDAFSGQSDCFHCWNCFSPKSPGHWKAAFRCITYALSAFFTDNQRRGAHMHVLYVQSIMPNKCFQIRV